MLNVNEIIMELKANGIEVQKTRVSKNGIEKSAITLGDENAKAKPCFYLDDYEDTGLTVSEIVTEIIDRYNQAMNMDLNVNDITSWDYAKDRVILCIQRKTNESILKREFLDLEMYARVVISESSSYKVREYMFAATEEEVFQQALKNTKANARVEDMAKVLAEMMGVDVKEIVNESPQPPMIVISNKNNMYGAGVMCDTELLSKIATEYDSNLMIIPSSIHECLLYLDGLIDISKASEMVADINKSEVAPEEVLSNHVYLFNKDTKQITW